jgi:hypothetical protein
MENLDQIQTAINGLKEILKISLPLCNDGNLNEEEFIAINKIAHEVLKTVERLGVKKVV